jgi:hypothetical protein
MARLVLYGSLGDYPDLGEVVDRLMEATWGQASPGDEYRSQVLHVAQRAVVDEMMRQGVREQTPSEVRAVLAHRLAGLAERLESDGATPHERLVAEDIRRWQARSDTTVPAPLLRMPPGDPIGGSPRGGSTRGGGGPL